MSSSTMYVARREAKQATVLQIQHSLNGEKVKDRPEETK
jgi:hypothetical protein